MDGELVSMRRDNIRGSRHELCMSTLQEYTYTHTQNTHKEIEKDSITSKRLIIIALNEETK